MNQAKWIGLFAIAAVLLLFSVSGEAQQKKGVSKDAKGGKPDMGFGFTTSRAPIDIDSDGVEGNQKENTVTFKGNVVARQEDITLYANKLVIFYDGNTRQMKVVVATGNVKVIQLNRRATSQKATFEQDANKVVFDGDAVVREGENVIRGERITYYVDEERSVVEPEKGGRVKTRFTPSQKEEGEEKPSNEGKKK